MSLFGQYESDDEEDDNNNKQLSPTKTTTLANTLDNNNVNSNDNSHNEVYQDYEVEHKIPIEKLTASPYGISLEEVEVEEEEEAIDKDKLKKKRKTSHLDDDDDDDSVDEVESKLNDLEPDNKHNNNHHHHLLKTTIENNTPPTRNITTPPTPTLNSPPYVSNLPQSTNPNFIGLYSLNVSSPTINVNSTTGGGGVDDSNGREEKQEEDEVDKRMKAKIAKYHQMKQEGINFNETLRKSTAFNNPSILEKLISFCDIQENGSNLPIDHFNPNGFKPDEFYDQLEKRQRKMEEDKFRSAMNQSTTSSSSGGSTITSTSHKKPPNKWDNKLKYQQQAKPKTVQSTSQKVGAVITSAPSLNTADKKKSAQQPQPQINSIFKKFKQ